MLIVVGGGSGCTAAGTTICLCTPERAWCGPGKYKGQSAFSQCFSRAKGAALGGLEAHLLCLGRGVAPAAADLAGAGLTEHGGGGGSRWSGALKRV